MDRDSDVETVLADDDWLDTATERNSNSNSNNRNRNQIGEESPYLNSPNNNAFDEEELFSPSGSLSSLDEFSDSDSSSTSSYSTGTSHSGNGPIVRNGSTPTPSGRAGQLEAGNTESEVDVVDDDAKGGTVLKTSQNHSAFRDTSPSAWLVYRGRKVIADEDDEDDGDGDNEKEGNCATGNGKDPETGNKKIRRAGKAKSKTHRVRRVNSDDAEASAVPSSQNGDGCNGSDSPSHTHKSRHTTSNDQRDTSRRKHRPGRRRRVRYDDPDYVDESGYPQLVYFASKGDTPTCRKLLARGATIGLADSRGWTALHEASKQGHAETLELLLNPPLRGRSSSAEAEQKDGGSSMDPAESQLQRQLRSPFPNVNAMTLHSRMTPLHQAVMSDDIQIVHLLLDSGALTNIANSHHLTPLDTCSNEKIARLLTDRAKIQRTVSARDKAGQTKLHRACNAGDLEQVVSLLHQGADINMKDNAGWTPLHEASLEGHNPVVVALLRHGAEHAARGFGGDTPLHDACANGHVDVVRSLLAVGADPLLKNYKNVTPEDMAEGEEEVLQAIVQYTRAYSRPHPSKPEPQPESKPKPDARPDKHSPSSKGKRAAHAARPPSRGGDTRGEDAESIIDIEERDSTAGADLPAQPKGKSEKRRAKQPAATKPKTYEERRSSSAQSRSSEAHEKDASNEHKRELVSLRRLREEAEKPQVNYYFSSNTSKLSRDERKLQVLMGTIERMEKRKSRGKRRQSAEPEPNNHASRDAAADNHQPKVEPQHSGRHKERGCDAGSGEDISERRSPTQLPSSSLSPKRRRGRPQKKRVIDDDDDDNSNSTSTTTFMSHHTSAHSQGRVVSSSKRAKHSASGPNTAIEESARSGRSDVAVIDGTSKPRRQTHSSTLETVATLTPTVEIKCESAYTSTLHTPPGITIQENASGAAKASSRHHTSGTHKERPPKHRSVEGGCTIVENGGGGGGKCAPQPEHMSPSSIAAQAIRYLPLYTIQLHSDPPTSKLDYFVVDLQIRLLLGMSVSTQSSHSSSDASDRNEDGEKNPLFVAYPHLHRQKVTESQKERLWEPLAGMFVSNMQLIHETAVAAAPSSCPGNVTDRPAHAKSSDLGHSPVRTAETAAAAKADSEIVSQFTLHEKKKFVALNLYFVKLDEIAEIVKRDYPRVSKQLITITLDISSIGLPENAAVNTAIASPRPITDLADKECPKNPCPVWNGPQKMLPLRYALKMHYRNSMAFEKGDNHGNDK